LPELPEVETVLSSLLPKIKGKKIKTVRVRHKDVVGWPETAIKFSQGLCGKKISGGFRRGKLLLFTLDEEGKLIFHLRMTGRLYYSDKIYQPRKHAHLVLDFSGGGTLIFEDTRRFGRVYLVKTGEEKYAGNLEKLGPEPLDPEFDLKAFSQALKQKKGRIKGLLLNQSFIAGLGNIYVDEILFRSQIHPETSAQNLEDRAICRIYTSMKEILNEAIAGRGTTFRDYRDGEGRAGDFQDLLKVYGREGEKCPYCSDYIERKKVAGRSSFFCPCCQKDDVNDSGSVRKR